jgi:hypothetical protein
LARSSRCKSRLRNKKTRCDTEISEKSLPNGQGFFFIHVNLLRSPNDQRFLLPRSCGEDLWRMTTRPLNPLELGTFDINALSQEERTLFYREAIRSAHAERSDAVREVFLAVVKRLAIRW